MTLDFTHRECKTANRVTLIEGIETTDARVIGLCLAGNRKYRPDISARFIWQVLELGVKVAVLQGYECVLFPRRKYYCVIPTHWLCLNPSWNVRVARNVLNSSHWQMWSTCCIKSFFVPSSRVDFGYCAICRTITLQNLYRSLVQWHVLMEAHAQIIRICKVHKNMLSL